MYRDVADTVRRMTIDEDNWPEANNLTVTRNMLLAGYRDGLCSRSTITSIYITYSTVTDFAKFRG